MIQLFSRHILIQDQSGSRAPISFDDIRCELFACFQECGVGEEWPAEHIALVLEEHFAGASGDTVPVTTRAELDQRVLAILNDAGFADVAIVYGHRRGGVTGARPAVRRAPWDSQRVEHLLETLPLPAGVTAGERVRRTVAALQALQLPRAGDELIRQLARHVEAPAAADAAPAAGLLCDALVCESGGEPDIDPAVRRFIEQGVIRPHRISRYLPRARLDLCLDRLNDARAEVPLLPLVFFPRLRQAVHGAALTLTRLHETLCREIPHAAAHPAHVLVFGLGTVVNDRCDTRHPQRSRLLQAEILACVEGDMPSSLAFDVIVTRRA